MLTMFTRQAAREQAAPERANEGYAWAQFSEALRSKPDVAAIARILNGVERRAKGEPPCELQSLPLKEALRLFAAAKACVRGLDPEIQEAAAEEVAHVICAGMDAEYSPLESQQPSVQSRYRRWAVTALNAANAVLEGRQG